MDYDAAWLRSTLGSLRGAQPRWHPLGFVSCTILENSEISVRLHLWLLNERRPKIPHWPIHTHSYDLASTVLRGCLIDCSYDLISGKEFTLWEAHYDGNSTTIRSTGQITGLRRKATRPYSQNQTYFIPTNEFHESIVPKESECLTLVSCTNFTRSPPLVLGNAEEDPVSYEREPCDADRFWRIVERAILD